MATINKKFLSLFDKTKEFRAPEIPLQGDFNDSPPVVNTSYNGQKGINKDFIAKGYVLGELTPSKKDAIPVMLAAFASKDAAPLKLRILKEGIATSVSKINLQGKDNALAFIFEGTEVSKMKILGDVLQEEIDKVIHQGLDQELLISILNKYEFAYKERNNNSDHKGFFLSWIVSNHWLYPNRSLAEELDFISQFKNLRKLLNDQNFVKYFFKKHFKENLRSRWLVMKPDPQFSKKFNKNLEERISIALKSKPFSEYEKEDKLYRQWVSAKETSEITGKTPLLQLSDFKTNENPILFNKLKIDSYEIIEYPQSTSGISYIKLFFDLKGVKEENLKNLKFFVSLIKKTDTDNYSFQELSKQIDSYIGNISFKTNVYQSVKNTKKFKPLMTVSLSFLNENYEKSMALLKELLVHSQFSPENRVRKLLNEIKTKMSNSISSRAMSLSMQSAKKQFFPIQGAFIDETKGGSFEKYILKSKIDPSQLEVKLKLMLNNIFNQKRLYLVTVTADPNKLKTLKIEMTKFKKLLPAKGSKDQKWTFVKQKNYEGYIIPDEVQYITKTTSFKEQGLEYEGALVVYSKYLNTHFMHPRIREQAGAYGAWSRVSRNGLWIMNTYRDPNLKKSFDVFSQSVDFMKNEKLDQKKLKPAILGSLKAFYQDRSVSGKADFMTDLYLADLNWNDYIKTKNEILETKPKNFNKINQVLALALKKSKKAVAGNSDTIKKEAPFLKEILSIP